MADPKTQMLQVSLPGAGKTQTYQLTPDTPVKFDFDIAEAVFTGNNGNLEIALEGGGTVILQNYQALADAGTLSTFEMMDGEQVAGDVYLFAFADTGDGEETELETAGDGATGGSGAGAYSDDAGQLGDGINALGGQDDAYDARTLAAIPEVEGNNPPIANDDFNEITEIGDPDFDPAVHVTPVYGEEEYSEDGPRAPGETPEGDFFALGTQGDGFYINYPNELPQIQDPVGGNVIANDLDPDPGQGIESLLMNSIDYDGVDSAGLNPGPVDIPPAGQTVEGRYGTLFIEPNGDYTYTLNEDLADELEEGQTFDEIFDYTIVDSLSAVSNTAQLTITVYGSNDAPYAVADTNVQAIEHGDSTAYQYPDGYPTSGEGSESSTSQMVLEPGSDLVDPTPGVDGYGTAIMAGSDDNSFQLDMSSVFTNGLNFYGTNYDAASDIYISTNGLISFGHSNTSYDPEGIVTYTDGPLIAIQYDDYDLGTGVPPTGEQGNLYYHVDDTNGIVTITWEAVGPYQPAEDTQGSGGNFVQIRLHDLGNGDFGIEYRYDDVSWTRGQPGDGEPYPTGGWTAGDGSHFGLVMGSGTGDFINVEDTSNVGQSGVYAWEVRDGQVSGELHDYTVAVGASGNVLLNDSDVDDNDMVNEPGEETDLFVMGLYSAYPSDNIDDQLDYAMPTVEDDLGGTIEYPQVSPAQNSFTVQGHYGELTVNADGSYVYTLDDDNENSDLEGLNYDRPGTDSFTYATMDDSGAMDYANLTFTVNGANDAPVAYDDANSIIEWGAGLTDMNDFLAARFSEGQEPIEQTDTIHGNVIDGDAFGGVADTDVDDTEIFVSRIYTKSEEEQDIPDGGDGQPTLTASGLVITNEADVYNDGDQEVTIDGQYGTLTIRADGSYDYVLNNENPNVDALNVEDSLVETFYYTARNSYDDGVESNEAELNITIYGNNDNPEVSITRPARFDGEFVEDGAHAVGSGATDILGGHGIQISDVDNVGAELTVTVTQDVRHEGDILSFDVLRANGNPHPRIQTIDGDDSDGITVFQFKGVLVTIDNNTGTIFMEAATGRTPGFNQFEQAMKRLTFEIDSEDDTPNTADRDFTVTVRDDNSDPVDPAEIDGQGVYSVDGVASTSFTLHVIAANDTPVAEDDGIYQVTELSDVTDGGCHLFDGPLGVLLADLLGVPTSELPENVAEGNVLANDWDPDQFAYGDTGAPDTEDNPNDLTDLRVIGLKYDGEPVQGEVAMDTAMAPTPGDGFSPVGDTLADGVFVQGLYGRLYMDDEGNFRYVADTEAANALAEGHSATETFTYMITDGDASLSTDPNAYNDPDTDTATVTFQIHGSNDQATIIVEPGADQGTVTEVEWVESPVDPNDPSTWASGTVAPDDFTDSNEAVLDEFGNIVVTPALETLETGGQLFVDDPDHHPHDPATFTNLAGTPVQIDLEDTFQPDTDVTSKGGTFTINELGEWTYEIDNTLPVVQTMGDGESFTETFQVTSYDGTDSHTITVTVEGSNDAPVITSITAPVEDFEDGVTTGWDSNETGTLFGNTFLGLFGEGEGTAKTFAIDHDADSVTIEFDMIEVGPWDPTFRNFFDTDEFVIEVGGHTVEIPLSAWASEDYSTTFGDGATFSLTAIEGTPGFFHHQVTITLPAPDSGELTLDLSANIEAEWWDIINEAFAIDNVSVASYDEGGLPMFSVIENTPGDTDVAQLGSTDVEGHDVHYVIDKVELDGATVDPALFRMDGDTLVAVGGDNGFNYEDGSQFIVTISPVDEQGGIGQDVQITVNIGNLNEPPTGEDFTMTVGLEGGPVPFLGADGSEGGTGEDADHVSDPEDPSYTGQELDVMITDLPDNGQLVYGPGQTPVTQADVDNGTQFDLNQLSYVPDGEAIDGVLLGSRVAGDATLSQWGIEQPDGSYDLVIDGVTVTTSVTRNGDNAELTQYHEGANHIGFGIADEQGQGLNGTTDDVLTVSFDGAAVSYAEIGFDGLGGYFDPDSPQEAFATWTAYDAAGNVVASGEVNNGMINTVPTDGGGNGDLFQYMVMDESLLGEGNSFTRLEFSTVEHGSEDGANWELRYIDAEFTNTDTFDYIPIDSGLPGTDGELVDPAGSSTVTVNILPDAPVNQDPTAIADSESVYEPDTGAFAGMAEVSANVLDNDLDPDNTPGEMSLTQVEFDGTTYDFTGADPITITGVHGTLEIGSNGEYTYTATDETLPEGVNPTETFKYTMTDGDTVDNDPVAQSANLVIQVNGLNDAPVALDDAYDAYEVNDGAIVTLGNVGNASGGGDDYDPDTGETVPGTTPDAIMSFSPVGDLPAGVTLLPNGNVKFDQDNPAYDHLGVEETMDITFQYTANDGDTDSNVATVTITVNGANDAPVLDLSAGTVTFEGEEAGYNNMLGIYTMADGNPVNPEIILVNVNDPNLDIGDVLTTYGDGATPNYFLVSVGYGATPTGTPEFVWDEANGEWAISFDGGTTTLDARFDNMDLNPNDPEHTFDPAELLAGRIGVDDQFLEVEGADDDDFDDVLAEEHDGAAGADHGPVTFTEGGDAVGVTGAVDISDIDSDNMSKVEISFEEQPGDVLSITLPSWASFGPDDGDAGTMTIIGDAPKADWEALLQTLTFENTSQNPLGDDLDTEGTIENLRDLSVTVYDDQGAASNTAHAFVQVIPVNDGPDAVNDGSVATPIMVAEDGSVSVNVLNNDTDPENDPLSIDSYDLVATANADGTGGTVGTVAEVGGELVFTPNANYSGPAHFNYTVTDGELTDSALVTLEVTDSNDGPVAVDDLYDNQPGTENDFNVVTEGGTNFESNPVNYLLVVDTSGSMSTNNRIGEAKAALNEMLETLQEQINISGGSVKVGLIDFDGNTVTRTYTLTDNPATTEYQDARDFVATFDAQGSTDYQDALSAANTWVTAEAGSIETQVIFMSDGLPNNTSNWQGQLATLHSNTNVIGVGIEMGSSNMQYINQINENGNGIDLDDPSDLNGLLQTILTETSTEGTTATGNVLDNDTDADAGDTLSVVSVALGEESSHGAFTALSDVGTGADDADTAVMVGTYGTLTINSDGTYEYTPDQPAADALSTGDTETEAFTYQMTDGQGGYDEATVSFLINGADDAPVAVNDVFAGMELTPGYWDTSTSTTTIGDTDFSAGTLSGGNYDGVGYTISAEGWGYSAENVVRIHGGNDLGIVNTSQLSSDDKNIDGWYDETMVISFDDPQTSVTIVLGDITGKDTPSISVTGGTYTRSGGVIEASGNITSITIGANHNSKDSFYLESLSASRTVTSTAWIAAYMTPNGITGDVLQNDFDAEDADYVETSGANTDLVVLGATGTGGYVSLDDTGDGSATSGTIQGEYGSLTLNEDGTFQYNVDPALVNNINGPGVETFEYQIADTDGMTSTATLEFPITVAGDNSVIVGTSGDDTLYDDTGDNVIFGLEGSDDIHLSGGDDTVTLGEGADTITIDPAYIGGNVEVTDFDINAGDQLDLNALGSGNLAITSDSGSTDLILTVEDVSGSNDLVITLNGVVSSHDGITANVDLATDNVNDIIQQIIDSPDNF